VPNWKIGAKNLLFVRFFSFGFLGTVPTTFKTKNQKSKIKDQKPKT